jgi:hypothetical protein
MKKLIATTLFSTLIGAAVYAQGTVNFANVGAGLNAPVTLHDGTTKASGAYSIQLLAGASAGALAPVGATTTFIATAAGYFNGGTTAIPTVAPGSQAFFTVQVWSTTYANFAAAKASGLVNTWGEAGYSYATGTLTPFTVTTGGVGTPASPPATLTSLTAFSLAPAAVPEPSTMALAGLGAAALLIFRRRK